MQSVWAKALFTSIWASYDERDQALALQMLYGKSLIVFGLYLLNAFEWAIILRAESHSIWFHNGVMGEAGNYIRKCIIQKTGNKITF